jgi:phosphoenolpyruvate synthase/pyruvate phosphate dikinase
MMWLYSPTTKSDGVSAELMGGKALGLYWLQSHGFATPQTWVLSTQAFDAMVQAAGVADQIAVLAEATADKPDWLITERRLRALSDVRHQLAEALQTTPLPDPVRAALQALPQNETLWAVRSSATVEDMHSHSFAGQFSSCLSVPSGQSLAEAIRTVWASAFDKTVLHYRAQHGTAMPRMAVVLQPMEPITADDRAGVIFSQSTIPELRGVLIQATFGAGTTVVGRGGGEIKCVNGAQVTPCFWTPEHIMVTAASGGMQSAPPRFDAVLADKEAVQLARQVQEIADQYGRPVDVEFVWRKGREPVFVQVRALTGREMWSAT